MAKESGNIFSALYMERGTTPSIQTLPRFPIYIYIYIYIDKVLRFFRDN